MKKVGIIIAVTALIFGCWTHGFGANLDDHMQYRIVSYSLGKNNNDDTDVTLFYSPLLITGLTSEKFNDRFPSVSKHGLNGQGLNSDIFALSADYEATPELLLHGAIGVTQNRWDDSLDAEYETSWEANLGVIYKIFNNIRYEVHFGYMETGDLFKETETYNDVESIIMISNKLTMSF